MSALTGHNNKPPLEVVVMTSVYSRLAPSRILTKSANLHPETDRGSQVCSNDYQNLMQQLAITCIMSRKGNCWDNAPTESFCGKMKYEWLNDYKSKTRAEAKAVIFEYIEIFYNRQRLHATNGYLTS